MIKVYYIAKKHWDINYEIKKLKVFVIVVQSCLTLKTPWTAAPRPPCPSPSPRVCSNSCPFSRWCHPTISSSVIPFSCPQYFPALGPFLMSLVFPSGGQKTVLSYCFSISPSNEYSGLISFRMDWFHLLAVQGILQSLLQCHSSKASIFQHSAFFTVQLSHPYMTTGKTIDLTIFSQQSDVSAF